MKAARRFSLQLTPLLDLLLIVIFAQYLDVKQRADATAANAEQRIVRVERALTESTEAERTALAAERKRLETRERAIDAENTELRTRLADTVAQQRRAADLTGELFAIPLELIEEALKPLPADAPPRSSAESERLRKRFQEFAALRGPSVVRHLLTYEELRKRADVWSLRIRENGEIVFSAGDRTQAFRADSSDDFAARLYERYKTLPSPKGLVVLLVSYGDARADVRHAVLAGLPAAIRQMRDDQLGRTQFEYAVLGYVLEEDEPTAR